MIIYIILYPITSYQTRISTPLEINLNVFSSPLSGLWRQKTIYFRFLDRSKARFDRCNHEIVRLEAIDANKCMKMFIERRAMRVSFWKWNIGPDLVYCFLIGATPNNSADVNGSETLIDQPPLWCHPPGRPRQWWWRRQRRRRWQRRKPIAYASKPACALVGAQAGWNIVYCENLETSNICFQTCLRAGRRAGRLGNRLL